MHIGIDGCRGGWLAAIIDNNAKLSHCLIEELSELSHYMPTTVLIDIPLHFANNTYRPCEVAAQTLLGPKKRASIFYTPHKEAVYAISYTEANELNRLHIGKGVSKQAWNIFNKIKEAVTFVQANPQYPLYEAHPELCFYWLNYQQPLLSKKSSAEGIKDRLDIIASYNKGYLQMIEQTLSNTKRKYVKADDIIDATILAIRTRMGNLQSVTWQSKPERCDTIYF